MKNNMNKSIGVMFLIFFLFFFSCATTQKASVEPVNLGESDLTAIGNTHLGKGEYDRAISYYNKALEKNPVYANAYIGRGIVYSLKGQYDQAISDFNESPRRKRTGYQSGIKTNLDDGGKRSFTPHPPSACLPHHRRMGYKKIIIKP
ncbi:MAG: tetratricopeptide repeat protein [Deltaproteobacteria bacterium]|nr:tetratricopeptide repeat protein [Deltaproteobacteria bacterium]